MSTERAIIEEATKHVRGIRSFFVQDLCLVNLMQRAIDQLPEPDDRVDVDLKHSLGLLGERMSDTEGRLDELEQLLRIQEGDDNRKTQP
jgi:hypothetical protein